MTALATPNSTAAMRPAHPLFRPSTVSRLLHECVRLNWAQWGAPRQVRTERCWPVGKEDLAFEWSFQLGSLGRMTLHGNTRKLRTDAAKHGEGESASSPKVTPHGIFGVLEYAAQHTVTIHSPDRDPRLPRLSECLDTGAMAGRLAAMAKDGPSKPRNAFPGLDCRLQSYRAGRRAAIRYQASANQLWMGKLFNDARGPQLIDRHFRLAQALRGTSDFTVTVPHPLGYLTDLGLAVFEWIGGQGLDETNRPDGEKLEAALAALVALHRTSLEGLPVFSAEDEWNVVERWFRVLELAGGGAAAATSPLISKLHDARQAAPDRPMATVHRDFYERQILVSEASVTLLDLDTLAQGDACVDLGNLVAHWFLRRLRRGASPLELPELASNVIHRYAAGSQVVDPQNFRFYLATSLFRLGAVHYLRSATRRFAPVLWRAAEQTLADAPSRRRPLLGESRT